MGVNPAFLSSPFGGIKIDPRTTRYDADENSSIDWASGKSVSVVDVQDKLFVAIYKIKRRAFDQECCRSRSRSRHWKPLWHQSYHWL